MHGAVTMATNVIAIIICIAVLPLAEALGSGQGLLRQNQCHACLQGRTSRERVRRSHKGCRTASHLSGRCAAKPSKACLYSSSEESARIATRQGDSTISTNVPATSKLCMRSFSCASFFNCGKFAPVRRGCPCLPRFLGQTNEAVPLPPLRNSLRMMS